MKESGQIYGLREAKRDLVGLALFDSVDRPLPGDGPLRELSWRRREIENYFASPETLLADAKSGYELVRFAPEDQISPEISEKLDAIVNVSEKAQPLF